MHQNAIQHVVWLPVIVHSGADKALLQAAAFGRDPVECPQDGRCDMQSRTHCV
jgi:hypothetical protein